jgi:hypothetical protein
MEFSVSYDYPIDLDRLWAALGRPDYPRRKYGAPGAAGVRIRRFAVTDRSVEVELERQAPVQLARLPWWARPFVPTRQAIRQRTTWTRAGPASAQAELEIVPVGLPVAAHGSGSTTAQPDGTTRLTLRWTVSSTVGERVAQLFAAEVRDALDADHAFTLHYLAQVAR